MRQPGDRGVIDRRVRGHYAVDAVTNECARDAADVLLAEIRSDLDHERRVFAVELGELLLLALEPAEQEVELALALQLAQTLRIRRRNVDRDVARVTMNGAKAGHIVEERALVGGVEIPADVQPKDAAVPRPEPGPTHVSDKCVDAAVVEAQAIDQRFRFGQTEQSRPRVARLGAWRHGTALDETEP